VLCALQASRGDDGPLDPLFQKQRSHFQQLGVLKAWEYTKGSSKTVIGILDQGFDYFHPDLRENLGAGFYANGGYHTATYDIVAHGTLVAGIIGARDDNVGVCGMAPRCMMLGASLGFIDHPIVKIRKRFINEHPHGTLAGLQQEMTRHQAELMSFQGRWADYLGAAMEEGVRYLVDHGASVINYSGGAPPIKQVRTAFAYAQQHDVVVVLAAGNDSAANIWKPVDPRYALVVGACTPDGKRWETEVEVMGGRVKQGSNFGNGLDVVAPTQELLVCVPHEEYFYKVKDSPLGTTDAQFKGPYDTLPHGATSCAAPMVASLAGLIRSLRPELKAPDVVTIIKQGCDDLSPEGYDIHTGHGRINFARSMAIAQTWKIEKTK
jgi:subtilisin family serine protease